MSVFYVSLSYKKSTPFTCLFSACRSIFLDVLSERFLRILSTYTYFVGGITPEVNKIGIIGFTINTFTHIHSQAHMRNGLVSIAHVDVNE